MAKSSFKTLYLVDGYAQFFRAYHAIRTPMTSPVTKEPTNLTFGFVGMLLKLLRGAAGGAKLVGERPDYLAVAIDVSGDTETVRSEIDKQYKANRPPPPEDLPEQVQRCISILEAIGVPVLGAERYEADDVIATLAKQLESEANIRVVSKDKDLKQLLHPANDGTRAAFELYDVHNDELITAQGLMDEFNVTPQQWRDVLALAGDTVDNIPGVEGVGPKTAAKLIAEWGTLENLLENADKIKGKRGERIREADGILDRSKRLVSLIDDVDVDFDLGRAAFDRLDPAALMPILKELGFNRYQDELKQLLGEDAEAAAEIEPKPPTARTASKASKADAGQGGLFDAKSDDAPDAADGEYEVVTTKVELNKLSSALKKAKLVAIDTETTSLRPMLADLCGLSFSTEAGKAWYVPVRSPEPDAHLNEATVLEALTPILEDATMAKTGHNLKYDLLVLRRAGVELAGVAFDTMVGSYLIDASRSSHSMDALSLALLGRENISIKTLIGTGKKQKRFDEVPLDQAAPYAAEDADVSLQLHGILAPQIKEMNLDDLNHDVEVPLIDVLAELEWNGIRVDPKELEKQEARLSDRIAELKDQIQDEAMATCGRTFEPDSPKQLAGILFNKPDAADPGLGIKPLKRGKTGPSTDAEVLEKLAQDTTIESPLPQLILEYRQLTKLVNTYLVSLREEINPDTKRIHASFNQTVAATGRLSSSDPNLQNIPIRTEIGREIRKAFVAPRGRVLIAGDYSQIELRILAHLSKDPALIAAFEAGEDIHRAVAAQIHGVEPKDVTREQRDGAKMVNFGIIYGVTAYGLGRRLGIGNTEAGEIIEGYKKKFAGITTFLEECIDQARSQGYVETMLKRRRPITEIDAKNPSRRSLAERMAINSVVQGSAADLIKLAMVDLHARLSPHAAHRRDGKKPEVEGVLMLLQIHDELVFEADKKTADEAKQLIVDRMQSAMDLRVPLVVEASVASNWYEGK
ncbi:MAG: DNA polymerase I [Phycisphaerales bacterium]|jgi:DNA polymerase-1